MTTRQLLYNWVNSNADLKTEFKQLYDKNYTNATNEELLGFFYMENQEDVDKLIEKKSKK